MATATTKPSLATDAPNSADSSARTGPAVVTNQLSIDRSTQDRSTKDRSSQESSPLDALQALLAFSVLHEQVRLRKAATIPESVSTAGAVLEFDRGERFVLDEVLQLVAERGVAITKADGLAIALAEDDEIVLRAAVGKVRPDVNARIDRDSAFSGSCFRDAHTVHCDDTETDARVNLEACRRLGARSMVAVPLCGRRRVIGVMEAFSTWPFAFGDADVRNLNLLAELVVSALRPEDEDLFAASAQVAGAKLERTSTQPPSVQTPQPVIPSPEAIAAVESSGGFPIVQKQSDDDALERLRDLMGKREEEPQEFESSTENTILPQSDSPASTHRLRPLTLFAVLAVTIALAGGIWAKVRTARAGGHSRGEIPQNTSVAPLVTEEPLEKETTAATPGARATGTGQPDLSRRLPSSLSYVTGIEHVSASDATTVIVHLEAQVQYEEHRLSDPDRVYFDLHNTQLASGLNGQTLSVGDDLIKRIRVAQPVHGVTRVVLETSHSATLPLPHVSLQSSPYRLIIEIRKSELRKPASGNKGSDPQQPAVNLMKNQLALVAPGAAARMRDGLQTGKKSSSLRIVVDAGHGGWDLGTVGRGGLVEKEVVLEIARRLDTLLESHLGAKVILTRDGDNYIPLEERAAIANRARADLLVSVHANYSDLPSARGIETYYSESFGSQAPADSAARARHLAAVVQRVLYSTLAIRNPSLSDRGVKKADFTVLTESSMPAILAEVSFMSSPADERKLRTAEYREQIAEALFRGIAEYLADSQNVKLASAKH